MNKNDFLTGFTRGAGFFAALLIFSALTVLLAQSMRTFSAGELISSTAINANFQIAAPQGAVMAFHLSTCPDGWIPADGEDGAPDLRGNFVRGLDNMGIGAAGRDVLRSSGDYQLEQVGAHAHTIPRATIPWSTAGTSVSNISDEAGFTVNDRSTGTTGGETRPENVALLFCMRKDV